MEVFSNIWVKYQPLHITTVIDNAIILINIYIDYNMSFFISYPLSALGHDISPQDHK